MPLLFLRALTIQSTSITSYLGDAYSSELLVIRNEEKWIQKKCPQLLLSLELLKKILICFPHLPSQFPLWHGAYTVCTGLIWACPQ